MDNAKEAVLADSQPVVLQTSSGWRSRRVESGKGSERSSLETPTPKVSFSRNPFRSGVAVEEALTKKPEETAGSERPPVTVPKPEEVKAEILFKSELIVRRDQRGSEAETRNGATPNFKRFKKAAAVSGNSFSALVPFAKEPYRVSSYKKEMGEYEQQEKKRKEAELVAEDLFNAERLKRRRVTAVNEARASISGIR